MKKIKQQHLNILILIISVFTSLLLVEIFLNIKNYPFLGCKKGEIGSVEEDYFGHFNKTAGWSYNEYVSYYRDSVVYHFDKYGFRSIHPLKDIDFSKPRILFIGDSVTFGYGLNYEDTYATKIGKLFKDKYEIINIGVQGYGTDQTYIMLKNQIDLIKPKYIIYTFISDHLYNRNLNYDRRQFYPCMNLAGTKPLFGIDKKNNLYLKRKPKNYEDFDRFKILTLITRAYDVARKKIIHNSRDDMKIGKALISKIEETAKAYDAQVFYIVYDDKHIEGTKKTANLVFDKQKSRLFTFISTEVDKSGDIYVSVSKFHPNSKITTKIAEGFYLRFKDVIQ